MALAPIKESGAIEVTEKRLYDEGVDLFWVTVIGLAIIVGGMFVMKRALHLSETLILAYMILSSSAFGLNILLSLWQIRRLARIARETRAAQLERPRVAELSTSELPIAQQLPSVTEHTTRTLEPVSKREAT